MDKRITVRYFRIYKRTNSKLNFENALQQVYNIGNLAYQRERIISDKTIRLERFTQKGSFFDGEVVRKQVDNIPPEASNTGLSKLSIPNGGGLGHCIAFRYNTATKVIAIQFDNRAVSIRLLLNYLEACINGCSYYTAPILNGEVWEIYDRGVPTKAEIEVASPELREFKLGDVELEQQINTLGELFDAPIINIEFKMGHNPGFLSKKALDKIAKTVLSSDDRSDNIKKFKIKSKTDEGFEELDFLQYFLKQSKDLELSNDDPVKNYNERQRYLTSCFDEYYDYISNMYL